jgi:hypothetical protein
MRNTNRLHAPTDLKTSANIKLNNPKLAYVSANSGRDPK